MAVRIKFDNTHNVIQPTFVLATRSGHKLGSIPATNISISDSFNSSFELEFRVNKLDNGQEYHLWDKITDFKLVWCREWDVWFEMYVSTKDDDAMYKDVSCISLGEAELSQIYLYNIEINTEDDIARDDYSPTVLYDEDDAGASLLNRIMEKAPHYSISHVDSQIASIQRTFTFDGKSLYDAFQEIAEEIDCIFVIDNGTADDGSVNRSIRVYDLESYCVECGHRDSFTGKCPECGSTNVLTGYGEDTTIFISTENLADNITLKTDTDSVKNCFRLEAGDDLMTASIMNCNPNGSQYIWYISDETKSDMSDELVARLKEYDDTYNYYYNEYALALTGTTLTDYNALVEKYHSYNEDLHTVSDSIVGYPALMNVYYDTIDMYLFLHDSFMPSPELSSTTAALQAARLGSNTLTPVAVQDLSKCSSSTASSAVLAVAKTIVDPRYQVKLKNGVLSENIWVGNFTVTNYSDETDTADSVMATVTINDDYEKYVEQKLDKVLKNAADDNDANDITTLFKLALSQFKTEIQKYCLTSLNTFCDACQSCLDVLIEQGVADDETWANQEPDLYTILYLNYYDKLMALQDEIKVREAEIAVVMGIYDADGDLKTDGLQTIIITAKEQIQDALNMQQFMGDDLWLEFISYRREDTYSNDNYISDGLDNAELFDKALEFIEVAKKEIYKSATLQHSLSATLKNLLVMKEFEPIVDKFAVGNWIRVKIDDDVYRLRLISYSIDFDDLDNISIEFSDVKKYSDGMTDSQDVINQAASMATSYDAVTRQASQGSRSKTQLDDWKTQGLALTKMKIIDNADNQNITWDSHGLLCREYRPITDDYSDKQLKIINRGLYLTDDNWLTSRAGIGDFKFYNPETQTWEESYGVVADTLIGNLILSEKVGIYNTENSIVMSENGILVTTNTTGKNVFTIQREVTDDDGSVSYEKQMYVDDNGVLVCKGIDITANSSITDLSARVTANANGLTTKVEQNGVISAINQSAESVSISASKINLNGAVTANNYFKINVDGSMDCTNATMTGVTVSGSITATSLVARDSIYMYGTDISSVNVLTIGKKYSMEYLYIGSGCYNITFGGMYGEFGNVYKNPDDGATWTLNGSVNIDSNLLVDGDLSVNGKAEIFDNIWIDNEVRLRSSNTSGDIINLIYMSSGDNIWIGGQKTSAKPDGNCHIVANNVYKTSSGSDTSLSDERYKEDIHDIDNAEDFIMGLSPKWYKFKDGTSGRVHSGFLAGDVKKNMEATVGDFGVYVRYTFDESTPIDEDNPDTYICGLRYEELIAPHIKVTQSHNKKIAELESVIRNLQMEIERLKVVNV